MNLVIENDELNILDHNTILPFFIIKNKMEIPEEKEMITTTSSFSRNFYCEFLLRY